MHETWQKDHQTIEKAEYSPKLLPGSKPTSLGQKHHCTWALKNISVPSIFVFLMSEGFIPTVLATGLCSGSPNIAVKKC